MKNTKTTLLAIVAVLLTIGALWFTNRAVTPRQATWDDVLAEGKNGNYRIITTDELAQRYQEDADSLFLVDTRQEWEFRTGHLKGAVNFPMEPTAWARWSKASDLEKLLGPDKDRTLVFY
ncbi:rhodanese-like domain-containing protein [Desulfoprunum benzoelyticum]|uniref:3-mercaptopyruvate sulfurtransferase SseA n=2 Tax=Desulfoprunum benzoelyticum TaxID=1506996 RepID=A0A840UQQ9_9BACT|nr:rhodanese-like domain-containing protein [Desulfoprunum benzoelyticum]MBB5348557.1 3-mercaptopyruvate sulfurtransferase SseA [Desulfoprunum benzoelyticum]MBM9529819.1 rhodanese-like domain-containing protein [Desulfoprunum benzoelyticum]